MSGIKTAYRQLEFKKILPSGYATVCVLGLFLAVLFLTGCNLVPNTPDGVFALYRDRMKSGNLEQARALLSEDSLKLVSALSSDYKLKEPAESMALLNALDPGSPPTVVKTTDSLALLNVRTLKGGSRLVRCGQSQSRCALESGFLGRTFCFPVISSNSTSPEYDSRTGG